MRCGCPRCEENELERYMIHSERDNCCICPECLYRCYACQGDGRVLSREAILRLKAQPSREQALFLRDHAALDASAAADESPE